MKEKIPSPKTNSNDEEPQVFAVSRDANQVRFNRREFLEITAAAAAAASLTSCSAIPQDILSGEPTATTGSTRETVVNFQNAPLFDGPGTTFERLLMLKQNDVLRIIGRSADGNWLLVATPSGELGWISTAFVDLQMPLDSIPVENVAATAEPTSEQVAAGQTSEQQPAEKIQPTKEPRQQPTNTNTPEPTATATPQPTEVPTMTGTVVVEAANVRIAPIANIQPIINLAQGETVTILGRSNDNVWVLVDTGKSTMETHKKLIGWMKANQLSITANDVAGLPIATPDPTPTPLPGSESGISPGSEGIQYEYIDEWGIAHTRTLPCGAAIPAGAVCVCNCVTVPVACSCDNFAPCSCDTIHYWYPN
jgi:hypothetical protein